VSCCWYSLVLFLQVSIADVTEADEQLVLVANNLTRDSGAACQVGAVEHDMEFAVAVGLVHGAVTGADKIGADVPAEVRKEVSPGHAVVVDVDSRVDIVVHVSALFGQNGRIAGLTGGYLLVVQWVLELFALTVDINGEIGMVVCVFRRVRRESDTEYYECAEHQADNKEDERFFEKGDKFFHSSSIQRMSGYTETMIATLSGIVSEKLPESVVVECAGVGYGLQVTAEDFARLAQGEKAKVYVYEHIREQSHDLFGFVQLDTKRLFEQLLGVKNVGPKVALAVLDIGTAPAVRGAIASGDVKLLQSAKGVGKRAAEQIVVELRDKVGLGASEIAEGIVSRPGVNAGDEAIEALISLGYSPQDATVALKDIDDALPVEQRVTLALKQK
jgi:Holliday junction DNA helicase RuvA